MEYTLFTVHSIAFTEITLVHIAIGVHRVKPPINSKKKNVLKC